MKKGQSLALTAVQSSPDFFDAAPWAVFVINHVGNIVQANQQALALFGYTSTSLIGLPLASVLPDQLNLHHPPQPDRRLMPNQIDAISRDLHVQGQCQNGMEIPLSIRLQTLGEKENKTTVIFITDRTTEVEQNVEIERLKRTLRLVHDCNQILVRAKTETALLKGVVDRIAEIGNCPLVWVGFSSTSEAHEINVARSGGPNYADVARCSPQQFGIGIAGQAIRGGLPLIVRNAKTDVDEQKLQHADFSKWSTAAIALPLTTNDVVIGCLCVSSNAEDAFGKQEADLLLQLADDLAYGLAAVRARVERKGTNARLRLLDRAIESSVNAVIITDAIDQNHPITYVNPAFERITGYTAHEALGRNSRFLVGDDLDQNGLPEIRAALREKRKGQSLIRSYRKDGSLYWNDLTVAPVHDEHAAVTHFISVMNDVTERKEQEEQIERHTHYDSLTGLPNRFLLFDRIQQATASAIDQEKLVGVVLINLDRFTLINDAYGHEVGDALLTSVGERLQRAVHSKDTVSRLGSDEFVVVLSDLSSDDDAVLLIEQIRAILIAPFLLPSGEMVISFSFGVCLGPRDGSDAKTLLNHAAIAMQGAKASGLSAIRFYAEDMDRRARDRLELEAHLRNALDHDEFEIYYQPIVDIDSGRIVEAEALLRWHHPTRGMLAPEHFIPLAEDTGLIVPIGTWVLNQACKQNAAWRATGYDPIAVSVNLSARQFRESALDHLVAQALAASGLHGSGLVLEVTETLLMENIDESSETLEKLKALGVKLALDDFGTGYSSLAYLKRLPLNVLKIDRSFVRDITTDVNDAAIAVTIISMAHAMNLGVVAEGVEIEAQLDYLRDNGCGRIQGYLFSYPVTAAQMATMLSDKKCLDDVCAVQLMPNVA